MFTLVRIDSAKEAGLSVDLNVGNPVDSLKPNITTIELTIDSTLMEHLLQLLHLLEYCYIVVWYQALI